MLDMEKARPIQSLCKSLGLVCENSIFLHMPEAFPNSQQCRITEDNMQSKFQLHTISYINVSSYHHAVPSDSDKPPEWKRASPFSRFYLGEPSSLEPVFAGRTPLPRDKCNNVNAPTRREWENSRRNETVKYEMDTKWSRDTSTLID